MELRTKLKEYAAAKGWHFVFGRRDYQNLYEVREWIQDEFKPYGEGVTIMFCDEYKRQRDGDYIKYKGTFMVLTLSSLDESYDDKREKYISPLELDLDVMHDRLECLYDIESWESEAEVNFFDLNADGAFVYYNLKIHK
ncbi:hypothetical protein INR75_06685 [Zunongwangia sp. SCSIO 43204]|uniref:hypothetical protein n=1 Tax=Zunongwangia sp. SCSIO 43204 TaxID=2779359 RepID=UPI001CA87AAB|nr:hypothetical protein [Zunongwangia sp. SCSIO 43204]UAB85695.1 hypothetical protein INR75_06685 [Zunongwangia sp. SCSIO 43204]